jgi:tRNA-guanine family transglycosylase
MYEHRSHVEATTFGYPGLQGADKGQCLIRCSSIAYLTASLIAGYYVAGHGVGESREERRLTVLTVLKDLPADKMRLVSGLGSVDEILEAVRLGFDILESRCHPPLMLLALDIFNHCVPSPDD